MAKKFSEGNSVKQKPQKSHRLLIIFVCTIFIAFAGQVAIAQNNYRWGNESRQTVELIASGLKAAEYCDHKCTRFGCR
jgi:hypothetical protein